MGLLLVVEDVSGDVYHLNHCSGLIVETNEISDLKLDILCVFLLDDFVDMDSNLRLFQLKQLVYGEELVIARLSLSCGAQPSPAPTYRSTEFYSRLDELDVEQSLHIFFEAFILKFFKIVFLFLDAEKHALNLFDKTQLNFEI